MDIYVENVSHVLQKEIFNQTGTEKVAIFQI